MIHIDENSYRDLECENGDYIKCNLRQINPHTAVCVGKTGLTVMNGACIINCDLPGDTVFEDNVCNPHMTSINVGTEENPEYEYTEVVE